MGICGLHEDAINRAMVDGLREAIKTDLTDVLMETAEKEVEKVIKKVCDRFEIKLSEHMDLFEYKRHIKLEFLITHEKKKIEREKV